MHQQLQDSPGHEAVNTAFTEWLFWSSENQISPRYDNMGGAIGTAGLLNMLLRNADIVPISDMTGIVEFGGIWKKRGRVFGVPAYWVFRMYSNAEVDRLVEIQSGGQKYDVERGSTRLPTVAEVPYLDVVAAVKSSGSRLTLFCVNRHLTRDVKTRFSIAGFRPTSATAHSIFAESIYEQNDETDPEHIHPQDTFIKPASSEFTYTFRHESVTVMELE